MLTKVVLTPHMHPSACTHTGVHSFYPIPIASDVYENNGPFPSLALSFPLRTEDQTQGFIALSNILPPEELHPLLPIFLPMLFLLIHLQCPFSFIQALFPECQRHTWGL